MLATYLISGRLTPRLHTHMRILLLVISIQHARCQPHPSPTRDWGAGVAMCHVRLLPPSAVGGAVRETADSRYKDDERARALADNDVTLRRHSEISKAYTSSRASLPCQFYI